MNRYLSEMTKAAAAAEKTIGFVEGLMQRAKTPTIMAPQNVKEPGVAGAVMDAGVRATKGTFQAGGAMVAKLAGGNVNEVLMRHASMKYRSQALLNKFEDGLKGMSDAAKLQYAHENLGPLAVADAQAAMNARAATRMGATATAAATIIGSRSANKGTSYE